VIRDREEVSNVHKNKIKCAAMAWK